MRCILKGEYLSSKCGVLEDGTKYGTVSLISDDATERVKFDLSDSRQLQLFDTVSKLDRFAKIELPVIVSFFDKNHFIKVDAS